MQYQQSKQTKENIMVENEEILLKQFKQGDDFALEELLKQFKPIINQIVRKYFLIGAEIEDLMQEGMIALYRAIMTFEIGKDANFKTYARVCIERGVLNAIKSANSKKNMPLNNFVSLNTQKEEDDEENFVYMAYDESNPESILMYKEKYDKLFNIATQNLSLFEKNVLELYLDGLNYTEIAERLDKATKSIDNALTRIKAKITQLPMQNLSEGE